MVDFIDEVNEELRRARLAKVWKSTGNYIIGVSVLIVVATAASVVWRGYKADRQEKVAMEYLAAEKLRVAKKSAEADAAFAEVAKSSATGFPALARMKQASSQREAGQLDEALKSYLAVAEDRKVDEGLRSFARIYAAQMMGEQRKPFAEIEAVLKPVLSKSDSPFAPLAKEQLAFAALEGGDAATARKLLEELAADSKASAPLRQRATVQAASLAADAAKSGS